MSAPPAAPADDAILTVQQVSDWTQLSVRQIQRLGIPYVDCGKRSRRYIAADVRRWLEARRTSRSGSVA